MTPEEQIAQLTDEVARLKELLVLHGNPDVSGAKKVFISLMQELPHDTVVMKYMSGKLTAQDIINSLQAGTPEGLQYISECLRIVRDMQARSV